MKKYSEDKARLAGEYFMQGYNCSQAVVAAWAEDMGLDMLCIRCRYGAGLKTRLCRREGPAGKGRDVQAYPSLCLTLQGRKRL